MSLSYCFTRIRRSSDYLRVRYDLIDLIEVDYEQLSSYREESIVCHSLSSVEYLQGVNYLFDLGIYHRNVFLFYNGQVVLGENMSKAVDGRLVSVLFEPSSILAVVNAILSNRFILSESGASDVEEQCLTRLREILELAVENKDYIECVLDC